MQANTVLIMAGGTGGHVYPALAVADYLRGHDIQVLWLGTKAGLEARVVPQNNYQLLTINVKGLRGSGIGRWLSAPFKLTAALWQALLIMRKYKPVAVLGMGGFVSGPGGVAAWLSGIPLFVHEQNAVAGTTNRLLAPLARKIMQAFPGAFPESDKVSTTGNPVREAILNIPLPVERRANKRDNKLRLLILGGSQGARRINQVIPATLKQLASDVDIEVWHQVGERHLDDARQDYANLSISEVRVEPFIEDMAAAYSWADLVLCRAGALTVAELCVVGLASILVPFPYAIDDHQTANARYLSDQGAALLLPERQLDEHKLARLLEDFYHAPEHLLDMANRSRALAHVSATRAVASACLEVAHG